MEYRLAEEIPVERPKLATLLEMLHELYAAQVAARKAAQAASETAVYAERVDLKLKAAIKAAYESDDETRLFIESAKMATNGDMPTLAR